MTKPPSKLPLGLGFLRRIEFPHKLGVLDRIYGNALAREGIAYIRTWNRRLWRLDLSEASHRWIVYGIYEGAPWLTWLMSRLHKGGVVIESGANIGQTLMYYAHLPSLRVLAFEPNPEAADWLSECLEVNQDLSVEVIRSGLSSHEGEIELQLDGARSTMVDSWYRDKGFKRIQVPVIRLDAFAEDRDIKQIAFWKLDVEGFEFEALEGASSLLATHSIAALMIEAIGDSYPPVKRLLERFGYRVFCIGSRGTLHLAPEQLDSFQNVVAIPESEC